VYPIVSLTNKLNITLEIVRESNPNSNLLNNIHISLSFLLKCGYVFILRWVDIAWSSFNGIFIFVVPWDYVCVEPRRVVDPLSITHTRVE
jgi:hypothetical protein